MVLEVGVSTGVTLHLVSCSGWDQWIGRLSYRLDGYRTPTVYGGRILLTYGSSAGTRGMGFGRLVKVGRVPRCVSGENGRLVGVISYRKGDYLILSGRKSTFSS